MKESITVRAVAKLIDHSLLHPTVTDAEFGAGCELAKLADVATVCVKPYAIMQASEILAGSDVKVCAVIGFPHGNSATTVKVTESIVAVREGATEIDMVINIGKALGGDWSFVSDEIRAINDAVVGSGGILKVIFENDFLQPAQIIKLCEICSAIGVAFVKTSTGYGFVKQPNGFFAYHGATVEHVKLMRQHCTPTVQIKAAGGIRTLDELLAMRAAGATRIGASATKAILDEARARADAGNLFSQ